MYEKRTKAESANNLYCENQNSEDCFELLGADPGAECVLLLKVF